MQVLYLHGFASSPQSSKATFLARKFAERGIQVIVPDLNEPNFSTLTVTRMLQQVEKALASSEGPCVVVGSSLGGFVAVQAALRYPDRITRVVLLAPALDFDGNRLRDLGDRGVDEWRRTNTLEVFHYGFDRLMPVHFELYEDAARYDLTHAGVELPIQIFQGLRDESVDPDSVRRWSAVRPNVELHLLDDDHQLGASLEYMWQEMRRFLEL